ncbi:unnamed protein product [Clonostachys rosea]|uniref:Uncharacterized protein n=1 Tax=Bionectria ochroleuca TaxID=29856 RepID=A0ABY6TPW3_BIOOC|nr:unnamed protein product [Clonostachys rosea]
MYESWFTYPLTRPYPFRWFTPVVIAGGVVLAVLFSFANIASNGHFLKPIYVENPNVTLSSALKWYMKPPFNWDTTFKAQCQASIISVGDRFFTSSLGLQYEVQSIVRESDQLTLPSLAYLNNPLEDCFLQSSALELQKVDRAKQPSWWMSWVSSKASAVASCRITTDQGAVNLTVALQFTGGEVSAINNNYTTHASTWWGQSLIRNYFWGVVLLMSQIEIPEEVGDYISIGTINYIRNQSVSDIKSPSFFSDNHWFVSDTSLIMNTEDDIFIPVKDEGRHYTRLLQSLASLDMGNCQSPNLLLDQENLKYAIIDLNSTSRRPGGLLFDKAEDMANPIRAVEITLPDNPDEQVFLSEAYDKISPKMGALECSNATIVKQYLCSVPQQKATGTMLVSILLTNLVFLQAAWKLLNLISEGIMWQTGSRVDICQGCISRGYQDVHPEGLELRGMPIAGERSSTLTGDESTQNLLQDREGEITKPSSMVSVV